MDCFRSYIGVLNFSFRAPTADWKDHVIIRPKVNKEDYYWFTGIRIEEISKCSEALWNCSIIVFICNLKKGLYIGRKV